MAKTFRSALLDALKETGLPLSKVASGSGVSYDQLKNCGNGPLPRQMLTMRVQSQPFMALLWISFLMIGHCQPELS